MRRDNKVKRVQIVSKS